MKLNFDFVGWTCNNLSFDKPCWLDNVDIECADSNGTGFFELERHACFTRTERKGGFCFPNYIIGQERLRRATRLREGAASMREVPIISRDNKTYINICPVDYERLIHKPRRRDHVFAAIACKTEEAE